MKSTPYASTGEEDGGVDKTAEETLTRDKSGRGLALKWKTCVHASVASVLAVLILNVAVTAWASVTFVHTDGIGTAYEGKCDVTEAWARWLHFGINVLSSILLSCSNYCMQLLVAPTRREVDCAHSKNVWLQIGVPSVRNLYYVSSRRVILWWLLALSSIPLHLLWVDVCQHMRPS